MIHDNPSDDSCQAASRVARILTGFIETLEKTIKDRVFEMLGTKMAKDREETFLKTLAYLKTFLENYP